MAKLILMLKDRVLKEVQLGDKALRIGRDPDNEVQLDNPAVSRFHAEIYQHGFPFYVEDKKSTNGTFLNGTFLNWKSALNNNDRITIGKHTLVFVEGDKEGQRKAASYDSSQTVCLSPEDLKKRR